MKFVKTAALMLAMLFVVLSFPSCGEVTETTYTVAVILETPSGEKKDMKVLLDTYESTIKTSGDEMPTVIDAITNALAEKSIKYVIDDSGASVTSIKGNKDRKKKESVPVVTKDSKTGEEITTLEQKVFLYAWEFTVNGQPAEDRANEIYVENGDHIVYYYRPAVLANADDAIDSPEDEENEGETNDDVSGGDVTPEGGDVSEE